MINICLKIQEIKEIIMLLSLINDSMFVDEYGKSTLLSKEMPYIKRLNYILITKWIYLNNNIQSQFLTIEEKKKKTISEKLNIMGKKILDKIKKYS